VTHTYTHHIVKYVPKDWNNFPSMYGTDLKDGALE